MRRKNETTTLLIVAHPGDQEIWAEELLMRNGKDIHVMITEHLIDEDDKSICFWETYDLPAEKKLPHYKMCETEKNRHGTRRLLERLTR